jgi:hypothetical protein
MLLLREVVVLEDHILEVQIHDDLSYHLRLGELVEYANGWRTVRGRRLPYEFRSVEQLRYDFERDVEAAGGDLG